MIQITEDYVSFEVAKLLKNKGFPQELGKEGCINTIPYYTQNGGLVICDINTIRQRFYPETASPTLQMAMKWLREVHHYYIQVMLDNWVGAHCGYYVIIMKTDSDFGFELYDEVEQVFYETPEKASEAAIEYCLENLI